MSFVVKPNLPQAPIQLALVDGRISSDMAETFSRLGIALIGTSPYPHVQKAISWHPDIFLTHVGGDVIVHAPGVHPAVLQALYGHGFRLVRGDTELTADYPGDIAYNVAVAGAFYFHNLRHTDPVLRRELGKQGFEPVNVAQGYSKCSVSVVDEKSIITADKGIAKAAEKKGFEVLLVEARQNIALPGIGSGFIGGSSGMLGKDVWAVTGKAEKLASFQAISAFLQRKQINILSLSEETVLDTGSVLPLKT